MRPSARTRVATACHPACATGAYTGESHPRLTPRAITKVNIADAEVSSCFWPLTKNFCRPRPGSGDIGTTDYGAPGLTPAWRKRIRRFRVSNQNGAPSDNAEIVRSQP